jgi:hypothetical protein
MMNFCYIAVKAVAKTKCRKICKKKYIRAQRETAGFTDRQSWPRG